MICWNKLTEKQLEVIIDSNIKVNINNKIKNGEVFTPYFIIKDMLDLLPKDIWSNPKLSWLEPGSGFGGFSICVIYRLLIGLKEWKPDFNERLNHILKNMIYMIEISKANIEKCYTLLGYNINIYNCDFLNADIWIKLKKKNFDVVIGNPPFNYNGMRGKGRNNKDFKIIWPKFTEISLSILNKNGYLLFFTPNSWTEFKSKISKLILKKQLIYYRNYDVFIAYKIFDKKAGSMPLCYFLLQNKEPTYSTNIYDKLTNSYLLYNIYDTCIIPNMNINLIIKIIKQTRVLGNLEKNFFFTPAKIKKDTDKYQSLFSNLFCFPLINYVHKKIYITYSNEKSKLQNLRPKLIFPNYSMGYPILDKVGILDVGGRSSYVIYLADNDIKKLKIIQQFFLTPLMFAIINSLKTAQKFLSTRTFDLIPNIHNDDINFDIFDNNKLYKYFNLTSTEIRGIEFQLKEGEGNLTDELKKQIIDFELKNEIPKANYNYIVNKIRDSNGDPKQLKKYNKRSKINI